MSDPLTDALDVLRISTTLYAMARLEGPWGVGFPAAPGAYFHVVRGEACWLTLEESGQVHRLGPGDVVLLPHGSAHRLTGTATGPVRTVFDPATWTPHRLVDAGGPAGAAATPSRGAELVCGAVRVREPSTHPLLALLPSVVTVRAGSPGADELRLTVAILSGEAARGRAGVVAVLARLGDVLLVQLVRIWAEQQPREGSGWLAALGDPAIGAALSVMHADPGAAWTVERLAATAGLSRSRFAQRFTDLVGQPPLTYLAGWRMAKAALLLRDSNATVHAVGREVGFRSEPAFNRAFTRHHGTPPGRYRRVHTLPAGEAADAAASSDREAPMT